MMPNFSDALPLTLLVPENVSAPIEVIDQHAALKMAVVDRAGAHLLGPDWDASGVYLLFGRHEADVSWGVLAGC